ncbi:MAG: CHAT domain-containing protein, partial [Bryobacteraceae bacterium]
PELHSVHWETLRDPGGTDAPLFMGEQIIVSRFLASGQDWRPIRLRPKADLTALVVIANPQNLGDYKLAPVDVPAELATARQALAGVGVTALAPGGAVALNDLAAKLREGFDILYLVCHGLLDGDEPQLFLDDGELPVPGTDLVQRIRELDQRPRLVVLASCQSAGKGGVGLAGLGPRLSEAGVPAVVAMQGNIFMETSGKFMKRFFSELVGDGQIDRAMSVARGEVRTQSDYWMPVLFLRLRSGRIWYVPGFDGEFEQWGSICRFVRNGSCVPILGPDVAEEFFGTARALATELAKHTNFPLDSHDQNDLAKVAQYILTQNSEQDVRGKVLDESIVQLERAGEELLGKPVHGMAPVALITEMVTELIKRDDSPLAILAGLNAKVFVNASSHSVLETFLSQTKVNGQLKQPIPLISEWRDERRDDRRKPEFLGDTTAERPYVYYVFGKIQQESTWVLTEDDFFDYLIRTSRYQLMPPVVSDALVDNSLLFLGFALDDWKFRVLFRMIQAKDGKELLRKYNHVGVQLDPGETTIANARRAKKYLERYFLNSKIDIYWGTATDFLRELKVQLDKTPVGASAGRMI